MITGGNSENCHSFLQNIKFITIKFPLYHCMSLYTGQMIAWYLKSKHVAKLYNDKKRIVSCNCYIHLTNQWGHSILQLTPEYFRKCGYDARNEWIDMWDAERHNKLCTGCGSAQFGRQTMFRVHLLPLCSGQTLQWQLHVPPRCIYHILNYLLHWAESFLRS